jgi:hypothetical protein
MQRLMVLSLAIVLGAPLSLSAQVCMSRAPFGVARAHAGGGFASQSSWKAYSAEATVGSLREAFGTIDLSHSTFDRADATTTLLNGRIGYQRSLSQDETVQFCPFAGLGYTTASSKFGLADSDDQHGVQYELGAAIGKRSTVSETLDVLPSLAIAILGSRMSRTATIGGVESSSSYTTGPRELLTASLGFLMQRRLTLTPYAAKSLNGGGSTSFGFTATISFGPPAR